MLRAAGYRQRTDSKDLTLIDTDHDVEFYYLRPRDIAVYIGRGDLDLGITGLDMLLDSGADASEIMQLGFAGSRFRFAARGGESMSVADLNGKRIATSYPGLLQAYLDRESVTAELVKLDGAVESAIRLGVADVIAEALKPSPNVEALWPTAAGMLRRSSRAALMGLPVKSISLAMCGGATFRKVSRPVTL